MKSANSMAGVYWAVCLLSSACAGDPTQVGSISALSSDSSVPVAQKGSDAQPTVTHLGAPFGSAVQSATVTAEPAPSASGNVAVSCSKDHCPSETCTPVFSWQSRVAQLRTLINCVAQTGVCMAEQCAVSPEAQCSFVTCGLELPEGWTLTSCNNTQGCPLFDGSTKSTEPELPDSGLD
jgi:hypothetical protein